MVDLSLSLSLSISRIWVSSMAISRSTDPKRRTQPPASLLLSGQTVPHVHIHIIPRKGGNFKNNDEIYDVKEAELKQTLDLDIERKDRTADEMAQEAEEYRKLFA
ncbi:bis(5'-adenosyl)-triphosphatase [Ranunculus cassubicifolius]